MITLISNKKALKKLAGNIRQHRLQMKLTQKGLALRAGVPLSSLRKFEQQACISLASFVKLANALRKIDDIIKATEVQTPTFASIKDVIKASNSSKRKRGIYS